MDIVMPSLGADMEEGTLTEWQIQVGDPVQAGDVIAVIETNKGAIDMEVFDSGVITALCLEPVATVPVGTVMAKMALASERAETIDAIETDIEADIKTRPEQSGADASSQKRSTPEHSFSQPSSSKQSITQNAAGDRILASPAARVLAQEKHINLSEIKGSGPQGAIVLKDVASEDIAQKKLSADKPLTAIKASTSTPTTHGETMRRAIATVMEQSKREIPHYYLSVDIDISSAKQFLDSTNADREPEQRLLLLPLFLRAIASVLPKFPQLNGYYQQGRFEPAQAVHIGNAINVRGGGLVVPAIHDVERLSLDETMAALRDVITRSRRGHLRSSELTDATITVSNIGERGADVVYGVIYPPQVAIIGIGKPQQKALVIDGGIQIRDVIAVTLSADHRVSDGFIGAKFLNALDKQLQRPEQL